MNTLELKGGMIELIAKVDNKELLQHLYEIILEVIGDTMQDNYQLSPKQEAVLDKEIEASYDSKNLVEHKIALEKMSNRLKNN